VESYIVHDTDGTLHIGRTIRNYLDQNHIKYSRVAEDIGMTRGGFARIFEQKSINTERLHQISKKLNHDFFKYLIAQETQDEIMKASEPPQSYSVKKKKPLKLTIEFSEDDTDPDGALVQRLNEIIRKLNEEGK